jgi:hypothetical protein
MKRKVLTAGLLGLALVFALALAGCEAILGYKADDISIEGSNYISSSGTQYYKVRINGQYAAGDDHIEWSYDDVFNVTGGDYHDNQYFLYNHGGSTRTLILTVEVRSGWFGKKAHQAMEITLAS